MISSNKVYRSKIQKSKLQYKRQIIVLMWATFFTYFNFTYGAPQNNPDLTILGDETTPRFDNVTSKPFNEDLNCTPAAVDDFPNDIFTQSQRISGGIIFHFIVSLYAFYIIAVCCDEYFVPSIERICEELKLSEDIAGASFMAIGTSAPELFTNIVGTFITKGDIGIGTILGSAVFNILAIGAVCGLAAKRAMQLDFYAFTRECVFYLASVIMLTVLLMNREIYWYESLFLIGLYVLYLIVLWKNEFFKNLVDTVIPGIFGKEKGEESKKSIENGEIAPLLNEGGRPSFYEDYDGNRIIPSISLEEKSANENVEDDEDDWSLFHLPQGKGLFVGLQWAITWPGRFALTFTIPDCRESRFKAAYPVTFIMCIVWIGAMSYLVSWMISIMGFTLAIPDSVMGLTFLAAGTSVPEAISSLIVVRKHGMGVLAVSSSIGSNTFDILICLGAPWLIRGLLIMNDEGDNFIQINSKGLEFSSIMLLTSLLLYYGVLALNKFYLGKKVGLFCLLFYVVFLVFATLFEMNTFFEVNLPTCASNY